MQRRLFNETLNRQNDGRPPVWFMRQAGRYHAHYQALRARHGFVELCKVPELACEVTMGPIQDFDFDAAILFSDILFPLESLGIPLSYDPAPKLGFHLQTMKDIKSLRSDISAREALSFQSDALKLIRRRLPTAKGLIGFVGAPLTLYVFGVDGSHKAGLDSSKAGLKDGRFHAFIDILYPLLLENMCLQAEGGIDALAVFDTSAGDFSLDAYANYAVPVIKMLMKDFKKRHPETKLIYYSKNTGPEHWALLDDAPIDCLGIDWHHDLAKVIDRYADRWCIQGNIDPNWLRDDKEAVLVEKLKDIFGRVKRLSPSKRASWVCGLGHGVLPMTPEANVKAFLKVQKDFFS